MTIEPLQIRSRPDGWGTVQELLIEDRVVSNLTVVERTMRIGVSTVRMGGIGGVGTYEEHRGKGYARRVLEHSVRWMAENGYDCSILFGISDFYHKFGYAACFPECVIKVSTRAAEQASQTLSVRPFTPDDLPAVRAIYDAENALLTGAIVRGENARWLTQGTGYGRQAKGFVFCDASGEVAAYAAYDAASDSNPITYEMAVGEVGARSPEYYSDIVRWAAELAITMRVGEISFQLPPDSAFGAYLTFYGAQQSLSYPRCWDGMGRIIRLKPFLEATLPEWTRRAREAKRLEPGASARLVTDLGEVTLVWDGESVALSEEENASGTVTLGQDRLMQAAMGYHGAETILLLPGVQARGDLTLFRTLFPRRLPYMWRADRF